MTMTGRLKACDQSAKVFITKQESLTVFISGQGKIKAIIIIIGTCGLLIPQ
jgi:hypothetical protein